LQEGQRGEISPEDHSQLAISEDLPQCAPAPILGLVLAICPTCEGTVDVDLVDHITQVGIAGHRQPNFNVCVVAQAQATRGKGPSRNNLYKELLCG
jgi:hypothetical protein